MLASTSCGVCMITGEIVEIFIFSNFINSWNLREKIVLETEKSILRTKHIISLSKEEWISIK